MPGFAIDPFLCHFSFYYSLRIKRGDLIVGNMSNNEETMGADKMDYDGEHNYLDYLAAKHSQGLQGGLGDGTDADIDTDGTGTDGGTETGGEGTGGEGTEKQKKQRI